MPNYIYTAKNIKNKKVKGELSAADPAELSRELRKQGLYLIGYLAREPKKSSHRIKAMEISEFSRQMSDMIDAGITVSRALNIISQQDNKPRIKNIYLKLYSDLRGGLTLSEAMRLQGNAFPELFINMCVAGEESGQLNKTMLKMADYYDKEHKLNTKVSTAMIYPAILSVVTLVVVIVIFTTILPTLFELFQDVKLPLITRIIMFISKALTSYWLQIIIFILIISAGVKMLLDVPKIRVTYDKNKLNLIVIGKLLKIIYTARFARTLSSLYTSGLPMIASLNICSKIMGNKYIESRFPEVIKSVREGDTLSNSVDKIGVFDRKLVSTIYIGEESGKLDSMLESIANSYDYEAETATTRLVALIEPIMIVVMAVIIGVVMLSVMIPLMGLYQNIR